MFGLETGSDKQIVITARINSKVSNDDTLLVLTKNNKDKTSKIEDIPNLDRGKGQDLLTKSIFYGFEKYPSMYENNESGVVIAGVVNYKIKKNEKENYKIGSYVSCIKSELKPESLSSFNLTDILSDFISKGIDSKIPNLDRNKFAMDINKEFTNPQVLDFVENSKNLYGSNLEGNVIGLVIGIKGDIITLILIN